MQAWLDKQIESIRLDAQKKVEELESDFKERMHTLSSDDNEEICSACVSFRFPCSVYPCDQCVNGEAATEFSWWKREQS